MEMKEVIGSYPAVVSAACNTGGSSNSMSMKESRPTMEELHIMLANHDWNSIQAAILKDSSIAMRIDDSKEEDMWFNEARRLKALSEGVDISSLSNRQDDEKGDKSDSFTQDDEEDDTSQLRYWAQPNMNANLSNIDATIRARTDMQQKRTLLHALLRMQFDSNESHGDNDGLRDLVGATKTAEMLIDASHNVLLSAHTNGKEEQMKDDKTTNGTCSAECPSHVYQHYCPPVVLPPVERGNEEEEEDNAGSSSEPDQKIKPTEMIQHTSVLTMPDALGNTPLHVLTGEGSIHIDLLNVILKACRPLDEVEKETRKPTLHDLLVAQNFHGCTPVHFLAGEADNEETLRLVLEECMTPTNGVHPTMVSDNEGDLPLHFATTYSSPSMLQVLTSLGDCRATLIRNSLGRLAIDNLIESYTDNDEMSATSMDDHNDDSSESEEDDSDESGGEDNSSDDSEGGDSEQSESSDLFGSEHLSINALYRGFDMKIPPFMRGFSLRKNWKQELWSPVRVLIETAAIAIVRGNCIKGNEPLLPPIHSVVIAIKYASFPAIVLFTSILQGSSDTNDDYKPKFFGGIVAAMEDTSGNTYRVASDEDREHHKNNVKSSSVIGRDDSYLAHVLHTIAIVNDGNGASRREVYDYIKKNQEEDIYWVMIDRAFQQAYDFELIFEVEGQASDVKPNSQLLEEDSQGNLPLHFACGDVLTLLPSAERRTDAYQHGINDGTVTGLKNRNSVRFNTDDLPHSMIEYLLLCEPSAARRRNRNGRLPLHLLVEDTKSSVSKDNFNLEVSSDAPKQIQSFHTTTFEMTTYQNITEAVYAIIDMHGFNRNERCHFLTFGNNLYQILEQGGGLFNNDIEKVPYYFMWEDTPIEYQEICKKIWYGKSIEPESKKLPRRWDNVKLLLNEYPEALVEPDVVSGLYPFQLAAVSSSVNSQDNNQSDLVQLETTYLLIMEDPSLLCQLIENR